MTHGSGAERPHLRIVFFGMNGPFSLRPLQAVANHHEVVGVVESTGRQAPSGRAGGLKRLLGRPTLAEWAARHDLPHFVWQRRDTPTLGPFLEALRPDVCCVASLSRLLPASVLAVPRLGFVNVHPSLLPKFRGPNPWFWTYHAMETEGGVTIHMLDDGEDTGDILRQATFTIPLGMPLKRLQGTAVRIATPLLLAALDDMARGVAVRTPQRERPCPLRARNVGADEPLIDWEAWPLERVYHVLKGTTTYLDALPAPKRLGGWGAWRPVGFEYAPSSGAPGTLGVDWKGWYVAHAEGRIRLLVMPSWPSGRSVTPVSQEARR